MLKKTLKREKAMKNYLCGKLGKENHIHITIKNQYDKLKCLSVRYTQAYLNNICKVQRERKVVTCYFVKLHRGYFKGEM